MIIRNEKDLYDTINRLREGEDSPHEPYPPGPLGFLVKKDGASTEPIRFDGYPRLEITLRGERFDGGVPTRIMPALLQLQRALDKTTAQTLGVTRLDKNTLRQTEIIVRTESGSTEFIADLTLPPYSIPWRVA